MTDAVAVVAVMSVQPTSEKWTVLQLAGSAAETDTLEIPSVSAVRAVVRVSVIALILIIA
jgi:uncharacterized membrane protein